jgi:hypothetical protein
VTRGARLPWNHCALTFKPIGPGDVAVMAPDGAVFNLEALVPYITAHHTHPVTGAALALGDVTKIRFARNAQGELCCPVLGKVCVVLLSWLLSWLFSLFSLSLSLSLLSSRTSLTSSLECVHHRLQV